jgi:hypothetical protein
MHVQVALSYPRPHSFKYMPRLVSLDDMEVLFLEFWGTSTMLSIAIPLIYIPTNSVEVFIFPLHPQEHLLLFVLLMIAILTRVR